jgi:hypothetical protein
MIKPKKGWPVRVAGYLAILALAFFGGSRRAAGFTSREILALSALGIVLLIAALFYSGPPKR